tara:strand:- start:36 stop:1253 length:1218 start_codon:yes stop_codon:yes gene_type:complete
LKILAKNKNKLILHITSSPHAYSGSGGRTRVLAIQNLHKRLGYDTKIICLVSLSNFFKPFKLFDAKKKLALEAKSNVSYIPTIITKNNYLLILLRDQISIFVLNIILKLNKPYLIYCHGTNESYLGLQLRTKSKKVIADLHGAAPEEFIYRTKKGKDNLLFKHLEKRELYVIKNVSKLVTVSKMMIDHIEKKFSFIPNNIKVIPCLTVKPKYFKTRKIIREELELKNKIAFVYCGSYRTYQLIDKTLELYSSINKKIPNTKLFIFTNNQDEIKREIELINLPIENYRLMSLERTEVDTYLNAMDFSLLLRDNSILNIVSSPTKFPEYLINGLPVITTDYVGDYSEQVRKHKLGYVLSDYLCDNNLIDFIIKTNANKRIVNQKCKNFANSTLIWDNAIDTYEELFK